MNLILCKAKKELAILEEDRKMLQEKIKKAKKDEKSVKHTKKKFNIDVDFLISLEEKQEVALMRKRKDKRYASFLVELCSTIEDTLEDLYYEKTGKKFVKKNKNENKIIQLEKALEMYYIFGESAKKMNVIMVRNYIIHEKYSLKKAKEVFGISEKSAYYVQVKIIEAIQYFEQIREK